MDQVKVFKGCLPQILLGLFLDTFLHMNDFPINYDDFLLD